MLANALGYDRSEGDRLQALQDRLIFGALIVQEGSRITDNQNARVYDKEPAWTTFGQPEIRNSGPSYSNPALPEQTGNEAGRKWLTHRRSRDYLADHEVRIALRLTGAGDPTLQALRDALRCPARPLFIGRKPCLPSVPILTGDLSAETVLCALRAIGLPGRALWPGGDTGHDLPPGAIHYDLPDLRHWASGLHTGHRDVIEGDIT